MRKILHIRLPHFLIAFVWCGWTYGQAMTTDWNHVVLEEIKNMPSEGGYAVTRQAKQQLTQAIKLSNDRLQLHTENAKPSFCSGATYLVLLRTLQKVALSPSSQKALVKLDHPDGKGVWGRWNANGPGTARLFFELKIGRNFQDFSQARPGDFLKIFWSSEIGSKERGHSVVYLGTEMHNGEEYIRFWSSNQPAGYGEKSVPRKKIARALFSRLEHPENFERLSSLPLTDSYLADMLHRSSTPAEMRKMCGY